MPTSSTAKGERRLETSPSRGSVSAPAAGLSIAAAVTVLGSLAALHIVSPELEPSWRMVSEYANGHYAWVLSLMFACWGLSSWALAFAIRSEARTLGGKIGLVFLVAAGIGQAMAAIFDINHLQLHDLAGYLGILGLPVAAVLTSVCLGRRRPWIGARRMLLWTANLTWISVVLMMASLIAMGVTYIHAGGLVPANGKSLPLGAALPHGTIAVVGYANRFLILAYCAWTISVAWHALKLRNQLPIDHLETCGSLEESQ